MIALAICAIANVARSQAPDGAVAQADQLFKDGRRAAERNDYAHACQFFGESFRLDPAVGTLVNLGDCAEHLGDLERAYQSYSTASARMDAADDRMPRVRERLESIDQRSAKVVLRLEDGAPSGTVVTIDGAAIDPHKTPVHLAKGSHAILATAVGYRGARYNLVVAEGEVRSLDVSAGAQLEAELPTTPTESPHARATWMKPISITAMGLGVASLWVGSLAGLVAIDRRDVQRDNCDSRGCSQAGVDAAHDGTTWANVSTVTFIAGAALLAIGVTLFAVSVAMTPHGVVVGGRFQ